MTPPGIPREAAEKCGALACFGQRDQIIDRPGQPPRPVLVVDDARQVDAIAPAEQILERDDDDVGPGAEQRLEQRIAEPIVEGRIRIAPGLP